MTILIYFSKMLAVWKAQFNQPRYFFKEENNAI